MRAEPIPALATIPAGEFLMGSDEGDDDERPVQRVHVDEFRIGVQPVTNAEYARFVDDTGQRPPCVYELPLVVTAGNEEREEAFRRMSEAYCWKDGHPPRERLETPSVFASLRPADRAGRPMIEGASPFKHSRKESVVLRSMIAALLILMVLAGASAAQTPAAPPATEGSTVTASGEGSVKRAPDRAWIQVTAESRARSPREAQKLNVDLMSGVLQKLRGAGLPAEAIQTRGYDLQPEYDYVSGKQTLRGYVARNSLEIRVDDLPRVGELLDLAVSSGATSVGNVRFDLKDRAGAEREALRLAVEDGRRRAEAAAAGAGMRVERILRLEDHRMGVVPPPRPMIAMGGLRQAEAMAGEPPIEAGELEVRASVTLTATIK